MFEFSDLVQRITFGDLALFLEAVSYTFTHIARSVHALDGFELNVLVSRISLAAVQIARACFFFLSCA